MQRRCDVCGKTYKATRSTSKYCSSTCRSDASTGRREVIPSMPAPSGDGPLTLAIRTSLEVTERLYSPLGQASIALAVRVDSGQENGSAVAALIRELRTTLDSALDGAAIADDPVDELKRRREQRRGA